MSNRLDDLRRQRELVQQHLTWLDAEIARSASPADAQPGQPAQPAAASHMPPEIERLLAAEAHAPAASAAEAKRGCLIAFGVLMTALVGVMLVLYLNSRSRH